MEHIAGCSWSSSALSCIGSVTVVYYLLRWSWQCWHGFRVYMMSEIWQTDLKAYGQWADFALLIKATITSMNFMLVPAGLYCSYCWFYSDHGGLDNRQVIQQGLAETGQMFVVKQPGGKVHQHLVSKTQHAVVTGATSGIGRAYAEELAKRGLDIVLISRSEEKLHCVAKEIESQFRRQTCVIQADFTEGHSIYSAIKQQLEDLEIGILVNNVGMNYTGILANFLDVPNPEQRITQVINCNILSVTQMSRLILPGMVERGKGLIINISSEAASQPQPMLSIYSATKIFVTYFSRCLNAEYSSRGITVQCVAPFVVSTNMTHNVPVSPLVKSAASFAREALNTVGYTTFTSGCVIHALQHIALSIFFPDWMRLSSFCVQRMAKFAHKIEPQIRERMVNNKQD